MSSTTGIVLWNFFTVFHLIFVQSYTPNIYSLFHSLEWNGIRDSGGSALADALKVNQSLKTLK